MKTMSLTSLTGAALLFAGAGPLASPAEAQSSFCFRGRPLASCRAHLVTEAGIAVTSADEDPYWTWEVGAMLNVGSRSGLGVTALAAVFQNDARAGFRLRYRHWLPYGLTLDIAPGVLLLNDTFLSQGIGFSGGLALGYQDWAAITAQIEVVDFEFGGTETTGFIGAKLGSYPAAVATAAALVYGIVLVLILPEKT